ncbi:MAG: hypothetical protein HYY43_01710 [Deltaproteobacteria bacterium]|nr:hypothetical protein [Deltaproteobacteria bacterium]
MADKITKSAEKKECWGLEFEAGGLANIETVATDSGGGWKIGAAVRFCRYDASTYLGVDYLSLNSKGKLFPDGSDATKVGNNFSGVAFKFGRVEENVGSLSGGKKQGGTFSGSEAAIGYGRQRLGSHSQDIGGETYSTDSESDKALYLGNSYSFGYKAYLDNGFFIAPSIAIRSGGVHLLAELEERQERRGSQRMLSVTVNINAGFGGESSEDGKDGPITDGEIAGKFGGDAVSYFLRWFNYRQYSKPTAEGTELLEDSGIGSGGGASQQTEDRKPLEALSLSFDSFGITSTISFDYKTMKTRKPVSTLHRVEKSIAGAAFVAAGLNAGRGGEGLVSSGLADLQGVFGAILVDSGLSHEAQPVVRWAVGGGLQVLGAVTGNLGIMFGGANGTIAAMFSPDPTGSKMIESSSLYIAPMNGAVLRRNRIKLSKDLRLTTDTEFQSHALTSDNAENRRENATSDDGTPYSNIVAPTTLSSGPGLERPVELSRNVSILPRAGIHTLQQWNEKGQTAGVGADADLMLSWKPWKKVSIDAGARAVVDKPFNGPANYEVMPVAGITVYD